ncbi:MAG: CbbQ/NirQ/NorQ C-terminal domain-containing protein, partial [Desulfobacula sp.]|nr:CbbQ/NirQ/NorQ C-terminal domain-containing protein [Desulfobacula sp.]
LPNEVEKEVLIKKTHITNEQADEIIDAVNTLRSDFELSVEVSTRTVLMIGEMVAAGATLKQALITSLQTSKETLESILLSLHVKNGYLEKGSHEYRLF